METVIRSPQDGVVKKLTHKEGVSVSATAGLSPGYGTSANFGRQDICKAGTVLVLFEDVPGAEKDAE